MHAVYGALLLAVAVVLFQFAYALHRRPVPVRWLRPEMMSQMFAFAILACLASGVGFVGDFLINKGQSLGLIDGGLLLVIAAGAVVVIGVVRRRMAAHGPHPA